jgi:hypothetical protein
LLLLLLLLGPGAYTRGRQVGGRCKQPSLLLRGSSMPAADVEAVAAATQQLQNGIIIGLLLL